MARRRIAPSRVAQIVGTIGLNWYVAAYLQHKIIYTGFLKHIPEPVLNCYGGPLSVFACPIGSFQQMLGVHMIPWLPIGVFVIVGALVGRAACGWMCPFGLWQDLLYKIKAGPKAGARRWVALGVTAAIAAVVAALLSVFVPLSAWRVFTYGWLPFSLLVLLIALKGKVSLPARVSVGGWLAGIGLGLLVWFKFAPNYGVVTGVVAMVVFGLTGRWFAAAGASVVAVVVAALGPATTIGPLHGLWLEVVLALLAIAVVVLPDLVARISVPSNFLKFAFLVVVAGVVAYQTAEPWFCKLCPQGTFEAGIPLVLWDPIHGLRNLVGWLYWVKVGILLAVVVASIAVKRPFCRLICPIGAVYSLFNKGSMMHMRLDKDACNGCGICRRVCHMDIDPQAAQNQLECTRCFECVWNCPKSGLNVKL
jgi:polyferredoxin